MLETVPVDNFREGFDKLIEEIAEAASYADPRSGCVTVHASLLIQARDALERSREYDDAQQADFARRLLAAHLD